MRTLRSHGLADSALHLTYRSIITSKLLYASSAWWGFTTAEDRKRLESFVSRSRRTGYCSQTHPDVETLAKTSDEKLISQICSDSHHVLHSLLPPAVTHTYSLRTRPHVRQLPPIPNPHATLYIKKNFISRSLLQT